MAKTHLTTEALSHCCIPRRTAAISQHLQLPDTRPQSRFFYAGRSRFRFRVSAGIKEIRSVAERGNEEPVGLASRFRADDRVDETVSASGKEGGLDLDFPPWKDVPHRYRLIGATALAFVVCNMDKVNLSIAIIPMSHQFGWNSSTAGLVQSSFFWGYALSQLPGGWLAKSFGGRKVLEIGVLVWSLATACVPFLAGYMPGLVLSRILVGIGEGVSPSAATDLIARTIPIEERSRAVSFVFGGLSVGSVAGFLLAPSLIQSLGWTSVFYIFGFIGIVWYFGFSFVTDVEPTFSDEDKTRLQPAVTSKSQNPSLSELAASLKDVPWKSFFSSSAVWAMIYAHFCGSWGHYTCLSWLPTYFSEELDLNLTEAAWVSVLPPLASLVVTGIAAQFADYLIGSGVDTTRML
uniref:Major facilitator superfamily (MFS) profile domain-containing protein n=1 Tax=Kalanchoe fedtschenkoi TaxID=63787 RepID=A0A7N0U548_KALFE